MRGTPKHPPLTEEHIMISHDPELAAAMERAGRRRPDQATSPWNRFLAYVRSRRSEHWIMFAAGVLAGAILG